MRVFLTGATGFIGSRIVPELITAGHQVLGLTRSDEGAAALFRAGAQVHRGNLEDPETLATGAAQADAVIHTAFDHDFTNFLANCEKDRRVIEAMGDVLAGSSKPFLITSGVGMGNGAPGQPAIEQQFDRGNANPRRLSELTGEAVAAKGVSIAVVRLPQVHDTEKQGLITPMIEIARARGFRPMSVRATSAGPRPMSATSLDCSASHSSSMSLARATMRSPRRASRRARSPRQWD